MRIPRRTLLAGAAASLVSRALPSAAHGSHMPIEPALRALVGGDAAAFSAGLDAIAHTGSVNFAPHLIFAMRYSGAPSALFDRALFTLTGEERSGWFDWMLWQEANPDVVPHGSYYDFKREILLRIDPQFADFLNLQHLGRDAAKIRFEEVTWGGVRKDGIPSLDKPAMIDAADADYLREDDLVFGVAVNGDVRAYPLRIMGWHEMFNDVIGGVPLALAYCTLCGSGILFETARGEGEPPFVFGSSGFLYRSNKLMFDRGTHSLWNQFTGRPVIGPLVGSQIALKQRPVVIAPWAEWRTQNPDTTVLSLQTGYRRDYGSGVVYRDYFASPDLMFPAITQDGALAPKDYVFGVRTVGAAKAWPLSAFANKRVINDIVGSLPVVLIGDPNGRSVRAYERGGRTFDAELTSDGKTWRLTEDALIGPDGGRAPRVPGHIAYWFAWNSYLGPRSQLYDGG